MRRFLFAVAAAAVALTGPAVFLDRATHAQGRGNQTGQPEVSPAERHDKSRPLRDIPARRRSGPKKEHPVGRPPHEGGPEQQDGARQSQAILGMPITAGLGFDGVGEGNSSFPFEVNWAPPDINGAAGLTQYVQWVNTSFAVFDKATGATLYGPATGDTLFDGFGGKCETTNDGDPIVQYDKLANRWVMTQFAVSGGSPYFQCVAVSETSDATGAWYRYAFQYSQFPDYPKLAVWPDAYYISFNMFSGNFFTGARICAYDRAAMLTGSPATQVCFQLSSYASLLPADLDGLTPPPAGAPAYFMNANTGTALRLWKFDVNFGGTSTLTGPTTMPVAAFERALCGSSWNCIPQLGTTQKLDTLGDRLMYRLAYRNFGSHESLVVNHSVNVNGTTGVRWYEVRNPGGTPSVYQQSTYAPDSNYRWMGSVAMDKVGNLVIGYSVSSGGMHPAVRFAGREATDPLNQLAIETSIIEGGGSQGTTLSRWGDYSSMSVDPVDDCTFWYTNQYLQQSGTFNWSTRIKSFSYPSCTGSGSPAPAFAVSASPGTQTITQGGSTTYDVTVAPDAEFTGSVAMSVSGLPAGATGTFNPASVSPSGWSSTLSITTTGTVATGTYGLTITGTSGATSRSTNVTLVVNPAPDFTIAASPTSRSVRRGTSAQYDVTVTAVGGFNNVVTFSMSSSQPNLVPTFTPSSVTGAGTSSLSVATTGAPKGTFTLTITGTSGAISKTTKVSLRVR